MKSYDVYFLLTTASLATEGFGIVLHLNLLLLVTSYGLSMLAAFMAWLALRDEDRREDSLEAREAAVEALQRTPTGDVDRSSEDRHGLIPPGAYGRT